MKPATYSTIRRERPRQSDVFAIYRHSVHYPRGVYVTKLPAFLGGTLPADANAQAYIARCIAEDADNRRARIADYLATRAARPAPVATPSDQYALPL